MFQQILKSITVLSVLISLSSCIKDKPDAPPAGGEDPAGVHANISIAQVKAMYTVPSINPLRIDSNYIISGIVNADDKDGNFYKVITLQDTSGGIQIKVDGTNQYTDFPVGRRVFVKLKGLYLGDYGGLIQVGGAIDSTGSYPALANISNTLIADKILKGKYNIPIVPMAVTISQLKANQARYQNVLIELDNVEFDKADTGKIFATPSFIGSGTNRVLKSCLGEKITVRSSAYALFATDLTPTGNGKVLAIGSYYQASDPYQILIRNLNDLYLTNPRCGAGPPLTGIAGLRQLFNSSGSSTMTIAPNTSISGVVISDRSNSNFYYKSIAVQNGNVGIQVTFSAAHSFNLGDSVKIDVSGMSLTTASGAYTVALYVNNVPLTNVNVISTGVNVTPLDLGVSQIGATNESTLVRVSNATFSSDSTTKFYWGSKSGASIKLTDGSGSVDHRTYSGASFANTTYPTSPKKVTGVVSSFGTSYQLQIRSLGDIQ